jgi:glycosyltransferase involved in cell wall biosynthesis
MPTLPLISIVLPTHNGARYLQGAIDSCLQQTWPNLEVILVDDASNDLKTVRMLDSQSDPRVRLIRLPENVKLPRALNAGFKHAQGELLTWTSDDNLYRPTALATMAYEIVKDEADFVYAHATTWDENDRPIGSIALRPPDQLPLSNCIGACFLYKREVYEETGDFNPEMLLTEDYDYWIRVSKHFRMKLIDADLYIYRQHAATMTQRHGSASIEAMVDKTRTTHFTPLEILEAEGWREYRRDNYRAAGSRFARVLLRHPRSPHLYRPAVISLMPGFLRRTIVQIKSLGKKK